MFQLLNLRLLPSLLQPQLVPSHFSPRDVRSNASLERTDDSTVYRICHMDPSRQPQTPVCRHRLMLE
jgi:hypothetical protein